MNNIQQMVTKVANRFIPGIDVHINLLRVEIKANYGKDLSYKQVRDALYRVREDVLFQHVGKGYYRWML